jgi:hypothetical protein
MKEVGDKPWEEWRGKIHKTLLDDQGANGSWSGTRRDQYDVGPVYQTSLSVLILSVPAK